MSDEKLSEATDIDVALATLEPGTIAGDVPVWNATTWDNTTLASYLYPVNITATNAAAFSVKATPLSTAVLNVNTIANTVDIHGDLNVTGSATFATITNLAIDNSLIQLAANNTADLVDIGFYGRYVNSGVHYATFFRDASDSRWKLATTDVIPTTTVGAFTLGNLDVAGLVATGTVSAATLTGTVSTASQPSITTLAGLTTVGSFTGVLRATSGVLATATTDHLTEGSTNLYFTNARVRSAVSGASGVSFNSSTGAFSLDTTFSPTFASVTLSNLTASRLVSTDGSKLLSSTVLSSWVAGTSNQITVTNNGSGGITLSTPQNINTTSTPQFSSLGLGTSAGSAGTVTLAGSSSGTITLSAGTSPTSYTLTLPSTGGTNTYTLTTNGSGTTSWSYTPAFGHQIYADLKAARTAGGSSTTNTWVTRTLNTALSGNLNGTFTSLSSNQITIQAGTYIINASAPAFLSGSHIIRLFNVTGGTTVVEGTTEWCGNSGTPTQSRSFLHHYLVVGSATAYRIDHQVSQSQATNGFGANTATGMTNTNETYALVHIIKIA